MVKISAPFRESTYYSAYKHIRNQFRCYDPLQVISACINYLKSTSKNQIEQLKKCPWLVLLLIKWVLIDEEYSSPGNKKLENDNFMKILQMVHDIGAKIRMPSEYDHYMLFLRNLAYQQFLYQHSFSINCLARQKILFGTVEDSHLFKREFFKLTGISIENFLDLSFVLLCHFIDEKEHTISSDWFNPIESCYPRIEIDNLFRALSLNLVDLKQALIKTEGRKRTSHEFYEQTPFLKFPLIKIGEKYVCIHNNILFRSLEHFIYDTLRAWDSNKFMAKFGETFERYIENGLSYANVKYVSEDILSRELQGTGSLIDFLINDDDVNILIDAKAVEMAYQGKITHLADIVKDRVKTSVIKAIEQSFGVVSRLKQTRSSNPVIKYKDINFLLVVTYKELYLGNGRNLYDAIAKNKLDKILTKYGNLLQIPLENMYFITIEEFDYLIEMIKLGKTSFKTALMKAKENDSDVMSRKFEFLQHLRSWDENFTAPKYIQDEADRIFSKIKNILKN